MSDTMPAADYGSRANYGSRGKRMLPVRAGIAAAWLILGVILFVTSRGHTLLIDNKDVGAPEIEAGDLITVYVDNGRGVEYFRGDRDRVTVTGSKHRIRIEFSDGSPDFEGGFVLPLKDDMYLLSVPKMTNGVEPFVEVFHIASEPRTDEDETPGEDVFGLSPDETE